MPRPPNDRVNDFPEEFCTPTPSGATFYENKNKRGYCWFLCPYSTANDWPQSITGILPAQKTVHSNTGGRMVYRGRGFIRGWLCEDDNCYYFTTISSMIRYFYIGPESLPNVPSWFTWG